MYPFSSLTEILAETIRWKDCPADRQVENIVDIILEYDEGHGKLLALRQAKEVAEKAERLRRQPGSVAWHCHHQVDAIIGEKRVAAYSYDGTNEQLQYLAENGTLEQELYGCLRLYVRKGGQLWYTRALWLCTCMMVRPEKREEGGELMAIIIQRPAHALERLEWNIWPESRCWLEDLAYIEEDAADEADGYSEAG
eukprot:GHVU01218908.1.p1 GENE.GHVU01218908.1~~GHVU01218908.1.p1  ORF type:complete len:196 (-),score=18.90 GHVU01218908.1:197-784(-)